jgi:hypothetical protein
VSYSLQMQAHTRKSTQLTASSQQDTAQQHTAAGHSADEARSPGGGGGRAIKRHTENFEYSFFEFRFDILSESRIRNPGGKEPVYHSRSLQADLLGGENLFS